MAQANESAALVIEHVVRKSSEKRYEIWLKDVLTVLSRAPGFLGREIFPPAAAGKPYTIIDRFVSHTELQNWLNSPERQAFVESMRDAFEFDQTTVRAGIDVWFAPDKNSPKPAAYKQFLLTAAVIYPISLIATSLLAPLSKVVPLLKNPFISGLFVTAILCGLMTYLIMPFLNFWLHDWLFSASGNKADSRRTGADSRQNAV